ATIGRSNDRSRSTKRSCSARVFWTTRRRRRLWPGISIRTSLRALAISIATRTALSGIEWLLVMAGHVSEVRLDTVTLGDFRPVMTAAGMRYAPPEPATFPMCYGTELTSRAILEWQNESGVGWHYIAPGKPWQNG